MTKYVDGRITFKHDTDANWQNASDFVPLEGEMVVYDADEECNYARLKVGDGTTSICDLPFIIDATVANTLSGVTASDIGALDADDYYGIVRKEGEVVTADSLDGLAIGVVSTISAVQEGTGDPSADNVRPITGWDAVQLYHGAAYDETAEPVLTVSLPEVVCGGTLDWTTGVVTITHQLDDLTNVNWKVSSSASNRYMMAYSNGYFTALESCSHYPLGGSVYANSCWRSGSQVAFNTDFATLEEWKAYLAQQSAAGTPLQILIRLAEPRTVQLDPQTVTAIDGCNTVWSDCGETCATFNCTPCSVSADDFIVASATEPPDPSAGMIWLDTSAQTESASGSGGTDGISPTVEVSKSGKITTLTITDAEGTKTATINDGQDGADGTGFTWCGEWSETLGYSQYDVVQYNGSAYIVPMDTSISPGISPDSDSSPWSLFAAGGSGTSGGSGDALSWCTIEVNVNFGGTGNVVITASDGTNLELPIYEATDVGTSSSDLDTITVTLNRADLDTLGSEYEFMTLIEFYEKLDAEVLSVVDIVKIIVDDDMNGNTARTSTYEIGYGVGGTSGGIYFPLCNWKYLLSRESYNTGEGSDEPE